MGTWLLIAVGSGWEGGQSAKGRWRIRRRKSSNFSQREDNVLVVVLLISFPMLVLIVHRIAYCVTLLMVSQGKAQLVWPFPLHMTFLLQLLQIFNALD